MTRSPMPLEEPKRTRARHWLKRLVGRLVDRLFKGDFDFERGDCFYCDGHGCRYCGGGYQPWCQMIDPDDPDGDTVCAKCVGGKRNSMGDECPNCRHFPDGINAPFHPRWDTTSPNIEMRDAPIAPSRKHSDS
jgi:hypothetical protein